jgi:hypothetical protein
MASVQCPVCHATASIASGKPYCPRCGWNRDTAIAQLRSGLKTFPFSILVFWVLAYFFFFRRVSHFDPIGLVILLVFPSSVMLVAYIFTRRSLNNLLAQPAPTFRPEAASASADDGSSAGEDAAPSAEYQALLRTSRPREIRMSSGGKYGIVMASLMAVGFAAAIGAHLYTLWLPRHSFAGFRNGDWAVGVVALLLGLLPYAVWRGQQTECDLLENGEVALAKITRQWSGKNSSSSIECEFTDFQGQVHKLIAADNSRKLYEGMAVPVFYERDNPNRAVAACATLHTVVT